MPQINKTFVLTIVIGVILQILFIFPDIKDTPSKAATEFTKAYFKADKEVMSERLCRDSRIINGVDTVDRYVHTKTREAADRGYGMFYMRNSVSNLKTHIISRDESSVELRLTGEAKPVLKSFFTGEDAKPIDEVIRVIKDKGKWKVCGNVFSIAGL